MKSTLHGCDVVVTGAGGFVGPHVVRRLQGSGARVRAIAAAPGQASNPLPEGVDVIHTDVLDRSSLERVIVGADVVVHLAGDASVRRSLADPIATIDAHVMGTVNVLEAMRRLRVRRVVYISSAEVYGRPESNPVAESARLLPRSPYGAAKAAAEFAIRAWSSTYDLAGVILRPFSIYGPGATTSSLIGGIVGQIAADGRIASDDLISVADVRPVRDYVFVDDVAEAIVAAIESGAHGSLVLNIGSGSGTSVGAIAQMMASIASRRGVVEDPSRRRPDRIDAFELVADVRAAADAIGWSAATPLDRGLELTIEAARQTYGRRDDV